MPGYTTSMRAVFVIDSQGIVRYKVAVAPTEQSEFDAIKSDVRQTKWFRSWKGDSIDYGRDRAVAV